MLWRVDARPLVLAFVIPGQAWHGWPVSAGLRDPRLLTKASAAPATCWAHQSAFVSLVSHCIIYTKGPSNSRPNSPACPKLAFPKLPKPPPSLSHPSDPPLRTPGAKTPYIHQHPQDQNTVTNTSPVPPTDTEAGREPFLPERFQPSLPKFSPLPPPFFPSFLPSLPFPKVHTRPRLGEIPFQHVFMTESKGRVNGASMGAGLCEASTAHAQ